MKSGFVSTMTKTHFFPSIVSGILAGVLLAAPTMSCASGGMGDQILKDFRIRKPDPNTQTEAIQKGIREKLDRIGWDEVARINEGDSSATVKFMADPNDSFGGGRFYKTRTHYEKFYVGEIKRSRQIQGNRQTGIRGYEGELEFVYRIYESARHDRPPEAERAEAGLATDETGRLFLKYLFDSTGNWDGKAGLPVKR